MTTITALRTVALLSNVLFIIYGCLAHIEPVLLLHVVLLPVNLAKLSRTHAELATRLRQAWRRSVKQRLELHLRLSIPADRMVRYDYHAEASAPKAHHANRPLPPNDGGGVT